MRVIFCVLAKTACIGLLPSVRSPFAASASFPRAARRVAATLRRNEIASRRRALQRCAAFVLLLYIAPLHAK